MQALAEGIIDSLTPKEATSSASPAAASPAAASPAQAEAEAAAPAVEPAPKVKRPRQEAIPKDSAGFFRARAKDPSRFTFTADGDLQVPEMRGEASKVIKLPYYRPATVDEIREEEEKQMDQIKQVEKEIDETSRSLRDAMAEWRKGAGGADEVMKLQRDLQRLDAQRTQLRSPIRWTKTFKNLSIRDVLVGEVYEVKKLGYPVEALRTRCMSTEQSIRSSDEKPLPAKAEGAEEDAEEDAEAEGPEEAGEEFTLFFKPADPDHGFLSPDTLTDFIFNTRQYNCVTQAYQAERIIYLKREADFLKPLLKTRSAPMMRVIGSKVVGQLPDPKETMTNILKSLVSQHPRFGDMLRATDGSTLVYADPRDGVLGIGIPVEDPQVTDRAAWKGTNFLGQAWQAVRDSLGPLQAAEENARLEAEAPLVQEGGARGKTLADEKKKRTGVLIARYRKGF